ncbi:MULTISPECIES: SapC family protein [unclassified Halomonas]|uniref:SapC family protein n=1 Tax=unclassified Halomonas TaxID=2609666 RepID=UPI001CF39F17|nr:MULTISPECIES: SapC family protein [unclassified Halomonas]MCA8866657.1 SapC family protein [Halomonas sp. SBBP1]UZH11420.1 SapC family protein [Halomonas sp. BDJS001]
MSRFTPLSPSTHQTKGWLKTADYLFMADQAAIALVAEELPHALVTMPVGFRQRQDGNFELIAICSLGDEKNLFVHPDGRWMASYKPALVRSYPFLLRHDLTKKQYVLCVDESSGLIVDHHDGQGEPFFNESGEPAELLSQIIEFLTKWERQRFVTQKAVDMMASLKLLTPWNINMQTEEGVTTRTVTGFYRIDEKALNALPVSELNALRQVNALPIVYAQLFAQHRLDVLVRLYGLHNQWASKGAENVDLESLFDSGDDSISFDFDS